MAATFDGVLADFNSSFIALIKQQTGIELPPVGPNYPDVWAYHRAGGVTPAQDKLLWKHIKTSGFWDTLDALPSATEAIQRLDVLRYSGADVYFITSRPGNFAKYLTEGWLMRHGFRYPTVLICNSKGPVAAGLELDAFIDDKTENCLDVARARELCRVFLVDAPYNKTAQARMASEWGIEVVSSANDALDRLVEDCGRSRKAA